MRPCFTALAIALAFNASVLSAEPSPVPMHDAPRALPKVTFEDEQGNGYSLEEWRGKLVVLNIWATWCPPCRAEMPTLDRLKAKLGGEGFDVIALSIDRAGVSKVRKFFDKIDVENLTIFIDDTQKAARDLDALGLPVTIIVGSKGDELGRLVGPAEWDSEEMISFLRTLVDEE